MSLTDAHIPYGKQNISDADVEAVVGTLTSNWLTQGPAIPRFEERLCMITGAAHAVAVCNATAALHIACLALDVGEGDWVWTSPNSFVASSNCALYCGARVDFVDIDPATYNMSTNLLADKLRQAQSDRRLPKVVIPVHFAGQSCDMEEIAALSKQYGFRIIEDASHAIGGTYQSGMIGSCQYSDIAVFSFHPVKIVTTAEGGATLTNDPALASRLAMLRTHGISRDPSLMHKADEGPWYYEQLALGLNYRITDMQAALGLSQLDRLDSFIERRHRIADRYDALLADLPLKLPVRQVDRKSGLHLYPVVLRDAAKRRAVFEGMRAANIGVNVHYIPIHTQPYYQGLGFAAGDFPAAEAYYAGTISLPMFPALTEADQDRVVSTLRGLLA